MTTCQPAEPDTPSLPTHRPFSVAELLSIDLPETRWFVEGILTGGLTLLAGKPKVGKSWLALQIAIAVASGRLALGSQPVERSGVLYLALEDTPRRLRRRVEQLECPPTSALEFQNDWAPLDEEGLDRIATGLDGHPDTGLVIVDTLARVRSPKRPGATLYESDYEAIAGLKMVADMYEIAIIVVHHLRKMASDDPLDAVSGTTGLTGAADSVMVLQREAGAHDAVLHLRGRDFEDSDLALAWSREPPGWTILGDAADFRLSPERAAILHALRQAGPDLTIQRISALTNQPGVALRKTLSRMEHDGQLQRKKRGLYRLAATS